MKLSNISAKLITKAISRVLPSVATLILFVFIGIIADEIYYKAFKGGPFEIDEKINIIDVCTLIATIYLAYYIPSILDKRKQGNRFEKDIIINRVTEVLTMMEALTHELRTGSMDYKKVTSSLGLIGIKLSQSIRYTNSINLEIEGKDKILKNKLRKIRTLITDTPSTNTIYDLEQQGITPPLMVTSGILQITSARISEITREEMDFERSLFDLIITINRG